MLVESLLESWCLSPLYNTCNETVYGGENRVIMQNGFLLHLDLFSSFFISLFVFNLLWFNLQFSTAIFESGSLLEIDWVKMVGSKFASHVLFLLVGAQWKCKPLYLICESYHGLFQALHVNSLIGPIINLSLSCFASNVVMYSWFFFLVDWRVTRKSE